MKPKPSKSARAPKPSPPPSPPPPQPPLRRPWLEAVGAAALAAALTWPMVLDPAGPALGHVRADGMKHLWTLWWMRASVWQEGAFPFHTDLINFPVGMDLYPIEPLNGLLAVLLPSLGVTLLSNALVFLNLTLTGVAGAWFGRIVSGSRLGGLVAGALLEGSAVMAFFVHVGVGELSHLWWLPFGLGCLLRARESLELRWFFALSACLAGAVLSCFYIGFFLAIGVSVYALVTLGGGPSLGRLLPRYALAAGLSLGVVLPVTRTFADSYRSKEVPAVGLWAWISGEHGQSVTDPASARLEPLQLVQPGRVAAAWEEEAYGGGRYIGFAALALALVGLARSPRKAAPWLLAGLLCAVLAMGSYLCRDGAPILVSGARIRLPLLFLNRLLGYVAEPLNFPVRFLAMTTTALSALAALAVAPGGPRWTPYLALLVPISIIEVAGAELNPWPWARFDLPDSAPITQLQAEPPGAVVDLALLLRPDAQNRLLSLSNQIAHGQATQAVPIERIEFFAREGHWFVRALPLFEDLYPLYERGQGSLRGGPEGGALPGDYRRDIALLRDAGFRWVLLSYPGEIAHMPEAMVAALDGVFGPPAGVSAGQGLWALPVVEATEVELTAWRAEHAASLAARSRSPEVMGPALR